MNGRTNERTNHKTGANGRLGEDSPELTTSDSDENGPGELLVLCTSTMPSPGGNQDADSQA